MDTNVTVTLSFKIPSGEIADVDNKALMEFVKFSLGVADDMPDNQFKWYELNSFKPTIKEMWRGTKKLI